jgi:hypothetical protein
MGVCIFQIMPIIEGGLKIGNIFSLFIPIFRQQVVQYINPIILDIYL